MTGKTDHQNNNAQRNTSDQTNGEEADNITDIPLGMGKQGLKDAADAILKAGGGKATASDAEEGQEPEDGFESESADPLVALVNDLKTVHAEKDELRDQLMRSVAEMENLRKRTRKEIADAREFAIASFARDLLGVSDNLRRAMDAVPEQQGNGENEAGGLKNLLEGVSLTERELHTTLDKHKVKKMTPMGEKFDPNFHQAMFEVENKDVPHNSVIEIVQDGYVIGERMLRPAMVGVAKGGPKISKPADEPGDDADENQ